MQKPNTKKYIMIVAVIGLLIFLHFTQILTPVESLIIRILNPVFSSFHSASTYLRITYNEQTDKRSMINIVNQLENTVSNLIVENAKLESIKEENEVLREYLKFTKESENFFVLGNIISRERSNSKDFDYNIIVDKGEDDGIEVGAGVVSNGIIIGKVKEVKKNLSKVCIITTKDCKLAVTIQNLDKTTGVAMGELGLTIKMEFIPQTEEVKIGDNIITSGLEENIPRGLVIGKVSEVNKESNELWQIATIEPIENLDNIVIVSIIIP